MSSHCGESPHSPCNESGDSVHVQGPPADWTHFAVLDEAVVPFAPEIGEVAEAGEEQVAGHQQADVHVDRQHLQKNKTTLVNI